jgi:DNA-binding transcriptional regulator GbsR (MarR family)
VPARKTTSPGTARARPGAAAGTAAADATTAAAGPGVAAGARAAAGPPEQAGRDLDVLRSFIERFTGQLTAVGFPRTPARIFVALMTADSSTLTAAELAGLLQTSPASVSGGVRYLIQVGLVVVEGEPGTKRQHYRMPETVWQDIVGQRDRMFDRMTAELREGVQLLGIDSPAGARMARTIQYFEFLIAEMNGMLARWQEFRLAAESGATGQDR